FPGGARGVRHISDVGGELDDYWDCRGLHDPADDLLGHRRLLADRRAHAAFAHAVRAAEVQLDAVGASVGGALDELMPTLPGIDHQRSNHGAVRPALLDFIDLAEVGFNRTVADKFDVVESDHPHSVHIER